MQVSSPLRAPAPARNERRRRVSRSMDERRDRAWKTVSPTCSSTKVELRVPARALRQSVGRQKERVRGRGRIAVPAGLQVVALGLVPDARGAVVPGSRPRAHDDGVAGQLEENARGRRVRLVRASAEANRQDVDSVRGIGRTLVEDVEEADRFDVVAPELDARRPRRPEREKVDEAAAHGVAAGGSSTMGTRSNPLASSVRSGRRGGVPAPTFTAKRSSVRSSGMGTTS